MTDEDEHQALLAAMDRLFAGTPIRSSGNLDIVTLAEEAGLKRNKLTHKHTDVRDLFYAEKAKRDGISTREIKLREDIATLQEKIANLREERDNYRTASETFARAMHVLTIENDNLRNELTKVGSSGVKPLPRR